MTSGTKERVELRDALEQVKSHMNKIGREIFLPRQDWQEECEKALDKALAAVEREGVLEIAKAHLEEATNWHQYGPKHDEDGWCCQRENELRNEVMALEHTAQSPVAPEKGESE